ncbi:MAG TPA: hypothetical protein DDW65_21650 [Firmicutes bacterium]|nr:hypothetical protein [Bacillota bacterium]
MLINEKKAMSDTDYKYTQHQLIIIANALNQLELDLFLERIEQAEALGPLINPTLYRKGAEKLEQVKTIALAAKSLKEVFVKALNTDKTKNI